MLGLEVVLRAWCYEMVVGRGVGENKSHRRIGQCLLTLRERTLCPVTTVHTAGLLQGSSNLSVCSENPDPESRWRDGPQSQCWTACAVWLPQRAHNRQPIHHSPIETVAGRPTTHPTERVRDMHMETLLDTDKWTARDTDACLPFPSRVEICGRCRGSTLSRPLELCCSPSRALAQCIFSSLCVCTRVVCQKPITGRCFTRGIPRAVGLGVLRPFYAC